VRWRGDRKIKAKVEERRRDRGERGWFELHERGGEREREPPPIYVPQRQRLRDDEVDGPPGYAEHLAGHERVEHVRESFATAREEQKAGE